MAMNLCRFPHGGTYIKKGHLLTFLKFNTLPVGINIAGGRLGDVISDQYSVYQTRGKRERTHLFGGGPANESRLSHGQEVRRSRRVSSEGKTEKAPSITSNEFCEGDCGSVAVRRYEKEKEVSTDSQTHLETAG